jgi:hypothetical protein
MFVFLRISWVLLYYDQSCVAHIICIYGVLYLLLEFLATLKCSSQIFEKQAHYKWDQRGVFMFLYRTPRIGSFCHGLAKRPTNIPHYLAKIC